MSLITSQRSRLTWIVCCALSVFVISGCDRRVTEERIQDQRETIDELTDKLDELQDEKQARVETAAAEARREEREEIESAVEETTDELREHREALVALRSRAEVEQEIEKELDSLKLRIDRLEPMSDTADVNVDESPAPLTARYVELRQQFDDMRDASPDNWQARRADTEQALNDLRHAVARSEANSDDVDHFVDQADTADEKSGAD